MERKKEFVIYQTENGALELRSDVELDTVWANLDQISFLFDRDKSVISRHINNIFKDEELTREVVVAYFATTTKHGAIKGKTQTKRVAFYNLDMILSIGYRVNSKIATKFRQWTSELIKQHLSQGYTINQKIIRNKKQSFLNTLNELKLLSDNNLEVHAADVLELIKSFSNTWFSLESYDKNIFPQKGSIEEIKLSAKELFIDILELKDNLIAKKQATNLFAQEKEKGRFESIYNSIFQTAFGEDVYATIEEKSAHLFYFIIKNHPFNDGNKRSGAFAFIWFLQKAGINFQKEINPQALTALTLLIAESNPLDKDKMIGIVLLLLQRH